MKGLGSILCGAALAASLGATVAAADPGVRSCGAASNMIANAVYASPGVNCGQARRLMHDLLGGSTACYPHGYTARPRCVLDGFHCAASTKAGTGVTSGRCVKGRLLITGTAGP